MSQPDLLAQLRATRPTAPPELRTHVRQLALRAPQPPRRRLSWRLGFAIAFAAGFAIVGAVLVTASDEDPRAVEGGDVMVADDRAAATPPAIALQPQEKTLAPLPTGGRVTRYELYLELRVKGTQRLAEASQEAQSIARSLGGYPAAVQVDARGRHGSAHLRLRIPRGNVDDAIARLTQLGTILAQNVEIEDLQAQVNATDRRIERLQRRLRALRAQERTPEVARQLAALTQQVERLQRGRRGTVREASYATIRLDLTTRVPAAVVQRDEHGPLHNLGVAFTWIGIAAVYALALGAPFVVLGVLVWFAARAVRRRREEALLGSS